MAHEFIAQSEGPGLTRALRNYELKLWPARRAAANGSVPQKTPAPPEPPPEPPKPPAPKRVFVDTDRAASECVLQRMAFCEHNGETRLILRDVSPDMLVQQAAMHVATLPIQFEGDASDVTTITAHVNQFLSQGGAVVSEEVRSEVVSRAVECYLRNPEIAEDRKRMQTLVEERAVDDATKQLRSQMPTTATHKLAKSRTGAVDGRGEAALLADANAALNVPEGVDKDELARKVVANVQTQQCEAVLQARQRVRDKNRRLPDHLRDNSSSVLEEPIHWSVPREISEEEFKKHEEAVEKQRLEAKARSSQKKSEDERMSVHERARRDQKERERQAEVAAKEEEKKEKENYEKDRDMHDRLKHLSSAIVDKSRWNMERGVPVEDDPEFAKPEAAPPEEAWNPGPARPPPPRAKATIEYGGATFDSFVDRPAHASIKAGNVSPAERFLQSILSAQKKRGAIEVCVRDGKPELRVNGRQSPVVGSDKIHSYVRETLMPFVEAIENLRRLGGPRMVTGYAKVDRKESARFSVGHNSEGVAELRVEGPKPVVKQGAKEVLSYIETKLPYKKDELKTLFQPVKMVSVDDFAPTAQTGVASLNPDALRKDKKGCARLYACYDPDNEDESTCPLKSFECDPLFRGPIEPPPAKETRALEAAERALEEAEKAAERAREEAEKATAVAETPEAIAAQFEKLSTLREAVRAAKADEAPEADLSRARALVEEAKAALMPMELSQQCARGKEAKAVRCELDLSRARAHVKYAKAALREADASLIVSIAFTRVTGGGRTTEVWLCGTERGADAAFTTEDWLKTKFSESWLKECKAAPYVGCFRLVTKRAWHIPPPKQAAAIVPCPPVASQAPPLPALLALPALDAVLQGAFSANRDLWRRAAVKEFEEGWAPSPSDAYAIGFSKTEGMWWVLLASLGNDRPHPVVQDWVHRHFRSFAFYTQGHDRPRLHETALTARLISEDWRMGHAASDATSEAIRQVNDAVKAAADAVANAAASAKLQVAIEAAQPHLPEEPIRSLMLSHTLKYRGAKSNWFAELESGEVVPLHPSVVHACIEPAFQIKCWEAFVAVTTESLTAYGREALCIASDERGTSGQERPPSDPLPDGVNWDPYMRKDLLGIGCARKGDLGFKEGASQPTEQWRVYYQSEEGTLLSIGLKGVLGMDQYKKSGKGSVADAISSDKGNAQKAKNPRSTQLPALHEPPPAPLLLTHKRARDDDGPSPADRSKASRMAPKAKGQAAPSSQRPNRAAAAKAIEKLGGDDEGDESDTESEDDADESEGSVSVESECEEPTNRRSGGKRKGGGGMAVPSQKKRACGAAEMAVPTGVVTGTPVPTVSTEPIPDMVERIKKELGLDASLNLVTALDEAEGLLGLPADGRMLQRATAVLAAVKNLRGKVQQIAPTLGLDAALNLSDAIAKACSHVPAEGTLPERADAILEQLMGHVELKSGATQQPVRPRLIRNVEHVKANARHQHSAWAERVRQPCT